MSFRKIATCLLFATAFSCSKPAQENASSSDTTTTNATQETSSTSDGDVTRTAVALSAEQTDRVAVELFKFLHDKLLFRGVALKEEFESSGNEFKYSLIRHNLDAEGMTESSYSGTRPLTDEETAALNDEDSTNDPTDIAYTEVHQWYTSQMDTFLVKGTYEPTVEGEPESVLTVVTCVVDALLTHKNDNEVKDGVTRYFSSTDDLGWDGEITEGVIVRVDFGTPLTFEMDELYLKAKIRDLTDADLTGLTKDQLGFVRNDIFARHGHTFKTPKMVDHYSKADWYHTVVPDAASLLNQFEKRNVDFIKKKEG